MNSKNQIASRRSVEFPKDDALKGLSTFLDIDKVAKIMASANTATSMQFRNYRITHIRYKPGTNCLIAFSAESDNSNLILFYAKCYLERDFVPALEKAKRKDWVEIEGMPSFVPLQEYNTILYLFPNDCGLTGLPSVYDSRKLRRIIYEHIPTVAKASKRLSHRRLKTSIARYKPERRAVIRVDAPLTDLATGNKEIFSMYVRSYSDEFGQNKYDRMLGLYDFAQEANDLVLARPLAYLPDKKLLFVESLPGKEMFEEGSESLMLSNCESAAHALASLHRYHGESERRRGVNSLLHDAHSTACSLTAVAPELQKEIEETLKSLQSNIPGREEAQECFVHGDFYHGQVLINNGIAAILDFDRSYRGNPLADVGNFCAHLKLADLQGRLSECKEGETTFLEAYASHSDIQVDKNKLNFWTALGLFMLSVSPYRSLKPGWKEFTKEVLKECQRNLN